MTIQSISEEVRRIQKKYGESDPFRLAQAMKIIVVLKPMGRYKGCCKGFYVQHRRIKHITINSDLPEVIQRVILAHEIAHSVLHTNITAAFHEFTLFDDTDRQEYEANLFAAELLLSDDCVLNALNEDQFFFQAAKALYVPAELLDFKFRVIPVIICYADGQRMKHISFSIQMHLHLRKNWKKLKNFLRR